MAGNIINSSFYICNLLYLHKRMSWQRTPPIIINDTKLLSSNQNCGGWISLLWPTITCHTLCGTCPLQGRNPRCINRRFVQWVYFALKRRGLLKRYRFAFSNADMICLTVLSSHPASHINVFSSCAVSSASPST